jgi:threonine dehydrogenase-like Zn-dependent dehydrogenase
MKQVFVRSAREVVVEDVPLPVCGDKEVLVANAYSVISAGTELSAVIRGKRSLVMSVLKDSSLRKKALGYLRKRGIKASLTVAKEHREAFVPLGYSSAGIVIALGKNVVDLNVGDALEVERPTMLRWFLFQETWLPKSLKESLSRKLLLQR